MFYKTRHQFVLNKTIRSTSICSTNTTTTNTAVAFRGLDRFDSIRLEPTIYTEYRCNLQTNNEFRKRQTQAVCHFLKATLNTY